MVIWYAQYIDIILKIACRQGGSRFYGCQTGSNIGTYGWFPLAGEILQVTIELTLTLHEACHLGDCCYIYNIDYDIVIFTSQLLPWISEVFIWNIERHSRVNGYVSANDGFILLWFSNIKSQYNCTHLEIQLLWLYKQETWPAKITWIPAGNNICYTCADESGIHVAYQYTSRVHDLKNLTTAFRDWYNLTVNTAKFCPGNFYITKSLLLTIISIICWWLIVNTITMLKLK